MLNIHTKRVAFRALHRQGHFILPNPWDIGGLRCLEQLGYKAIATTSRGYAHSLGQEDYHLTLAQVLSHIAYLNDATDLPVNVDFEGGFADDPSGVAINVVKAIQAGAAGLSIEDRSGDNLYDLSLSVERIQASREAIDHSGHDVLLIGRCEGLLIKKTDIDTTIARLVAYSNAGADVLYAPAIHDHAAIKDLVQAVSPKPVNVLLRNASMRIDEMAELGVRRFSTGSALANAASAAFDLTARSLLTTGHLPAA